MIWNTLHNKYCLMVCIIGVAFWMFYRGTFDYGTSQIYKTTQIHVEKINTTGQCIIPDIADYDQFYNYFVKEKFICKDMETVGGHLNSGRLDGNKWVCFDNGFKPDDCVVYSFGISNDWTFDDYIDQMRHCQVFAFDPTMNATNHKRSRRITFYNLGISNSKGYKRMRGKNCAMDRYRGIVELLGHTSTKIDYLKMDIEGSEIPVFMDILDNDLDLLNNVQQIGLEIHPLKPVPGEVVSKTFKNFWIVFHRLECLGWRLLYAEMNQLPGNHFSFNGFTRSSCYEVVLIKT